MQTIIDQRGEAKCMVLKVKTPRVAFFEYLMLPDGRVLGQVANPQLAAAIPTSDPGRLIWPTFRDILCR